jgi:AcrR family transcriptional regulator
MQRPDERKRQLITATAARMFATQPFHKVRLDDIAAEAGVGKGTLYIYFENKEDLYFSLVYQGFAELVDRLQAQLAGEPAGASRAVRRVVEGLVAFAFANPQLFEIMRTVGAGKGRTGNAWKEKRLELHGLIRDALARGVRAGELRDPRPELTAACIPGMVRSIVLFGPKDVDGQTACDHIMRILETGIVRGAGQ